MANYFWNVTVRNRQNQPIFEVQDEDIQNCFEKAIPPLFVHSASTVDVQLVREKDGADNDTVTFDIAQKGFTGRFSKHNANVPVTQSRQIETALNNLFFPFSF